MRYALSKYGIVDLKDGDVAESESAMLDDYFRYIDITHSRSEADEILNNLEVKSILSQYITDEDIDLSRFACSGSIFYSIEDGCGYIRPMQMSKSISVENDTDDVVHVDLSNHYGNIKSLSVQKCTVTFPEQPKFGISKLLMFAGCSGIDGKLEYISEFEANSIDLKTLNNAVNCTDAIGSVNVACEIYDDEAYIKVGSVKKNLKLFVNTFVLKGRIIIDMCGKDTVDGEIEVKAGEGFGSGYDYDIEILFINTADREKTANKVSALGDLSDVFDMLMSESPIKLVLNRINGKFGCTVTKQTVSGETLNVGKNIEYIEYE